MHYPLAVFSAILAATTGASQAFACDTSPDLERIPGATDAEHEYRYNAYERDQETILAFESETRSIENSWKVFLGKVEMVTEASEKKNIRTVRVKPVWQVRGLLPAGPKTVDEGPLSSCHRDRQLRGSKTGDLIIVFESPGSIGAMRAEQARSGELIDAITMYALSLDKTAK